MSWSKSTYGHCMVISLTPVEFPGIRPHLVALTSFDASAWQVQGTVAYVSIQQGKWMMCINIPCFMTDWNLEDPFKVTHQFDWAVMSPAEDSSPGCQVRRRRTGKEDTIIAMVINQVNVAQQLDWHGQHSFIKAASKEHQVARASLVFLTRCREPGPIERFLLDGWGDTQQHLYGCCIEETPYLRGSCTHFTQVIHIQSAYAINLMHNHHWNRCKSK